MVWRYLWFHYFILNACIHMGDKRKQKMRLVYMIYLIISIEGLKYLAMFENTKMNKSWLSHQAVDDKDASMYVYGQQGELLWFCAKLTVAWKKERRKRDSLFLGMYCVRVFRGLLLTYFLKSSRKTIILISIMPDLFVDKLKLQIVQ